MSAPSSGLLRRAEEISARVAQACGIASILLTLAMTTLILIQVVLRYAFQAAPWWTEEAARYCMIWAGLLGATVAFHGRLDLMLFSSERGSPAVRLARSAARNIAALIFVIPLLVYSPAFIERHMHRTTDALGWTSAIVVAIIPLFALIITFHAVVGICISAAGHRRPATPPTG